MIRHWLTMAALVAELRAKLCGSILAECYKTNDSDVCFHFGNAHGIITLVVAPHQPLRGIYAHCHNPPKERLRLFPLVEATTLEAIWIAEANRVITLTLGNFEIIIVAIPGAIDCVLRTRDDHRVLASGLGTIDSNSHKQWEPPATLCRQPQMFSPEATLQEVLERSTLMLATPYALHVLKQLRLDQLKAWGTLDTLQRTRLLDAALHYRDTLIEHPQCAIAYADPNHAPLFLLDRIELDGWVVEPASNVIEGLLQCVRAFYRVWTIEQRRTALRRTLHTELARIERALEQLHADVTAAKDSDRFEQWAHMLIVHPQRHRRGLDQLRCVGWDGTQHIVPLDPSRTVLENAEHYFARARKLRRGATVARERIEHLRVRQQLCTYGLERLSQACSLDALDALASELLPGSSIARTRAQRPLRSRGRFRSFQLTGGYVLLVGKDARSNDELTFRIAGPHDLWLHARDVEGAHGVLRLPDRKLPPTHILEQAAAIVAYYSAARNALHVPVSWTQRKYVRRPKRAQPGTVELMREEVVFVDPWHPSSEAID